MDKEGIEKVVHESYEFILKMLEENLEFRLTINITGCLTEQLQKYEFTDILERFRKLAEKKQIQLVETAAYHPFLPLLPEEEIIYQVKKNHEINKKFFGDAYHPSGFFIPEMAYSLKIAKIIARLGYKWLILDDIHLGGKLGNVNYNKGYIIKNLKLKVLFRNRGISKSYVPQKISNLLKEEKISRNIITATDGELYGHHHKDIEGYLHSVLKNKKIQTLTVSEFLKKIKIWEEITLAAASWESSEKEIKNKEPYILWNNSRNKIQKKLWKLADLAIRTVNKNKTDENYHWARAHLNKGLASCTFWWAAAHDFRDSFGPISWSPDEIEKGLNEMIKSIRSLNNASRMTKIKAERLYIKLKQMIWEKHWKYYWKT